MRFRVVLLVFLLACSFLLAGKFWEEKAYTEWNEKESLKILNDSPWGETYTITDTTQMTFQPGTAGDQNVNREVYRHFRVRWISARPVRMAISRLTAIAAKKSDDLELDKFVASSFDQHIVIGIDFDTNEPRYKGELFSHFAATTTGDLRNSNYLVRASDGKKNFLSEYFPPGNTGLGARFVFPRAVDGQPFVTESEKTVRLVADLRGLYKLIVPFKPKEMVFKGKLEY